MLGAGVFLEFVEADRAARVHVLDALSDAFEHAGVLGYLANFEKGVRSRLVKRLLTPFSNYGLEGSTPRICASLRVSYGWLLKFQ